ncbi:dihydroxyacetone kinase-like protein [Virgibacillus halotolerans]|uniref:dihydroxyacetone kinase subunit DhaL n=1 Tax=Virgibacillus halotolerans TaxID=1071053 RepID=UPI0019605066|nr:dihydroxyacetone kinase subunit DhaL [Virgibacillus halotolerans]MBM7599422.1 dihydroxyacetone kinase-like protein [Virgibacillus halotolerans]
MKLTVNNSIQWFLKANEKMQENKEYLTLLDKKIGDSDHGINMARGFQEVANKLPTQDYASVSDVLKDVAMTLMSKVGGAAGPLYGTIFLKMSTAVKGTDPVDYQTFTNGLEEGLVGVKQRGKADVGEKTLVDVWAPVVDFFKQGVDFQADQLVETAENAMDNTKDIQASKGRAAYFKEKSIGHIDPGSTSSFYIFEALAEVIREGE